MTGAQVLHNSQFLLTTSLYLGPLRVQVALVSGDLDHAHSSHSNVSWTPDVLSGAGQFCLYQVFDCPPWQDDVLKVYAYTVIQQGTEAVNQSE